MLYSLFRLLHLAAIILLAATVVIENIAIKASISGEDARNLAKVDKVAGLGLALTLIFGLLLWFVVGKPAEFYSGNPVFHAKLGLFALLLAAAAYPALFFIRNGKRDAADDQEAIAVPTAVRLLLRCELLLLALMPVLAFLMARGIGLS